MFNRMKYKELEKKVKSIGCYDTRKQMNVTLFGTVQLQENTFR